MATFPDTPSPENKQTNNPSNNTRKQTNNNNKEKKKERGKKKKKKKEEEEKKKHTRQVPLQFHFNAMLFTLSGFFPDSRAVAVDGGGARGRHWPGGCTEGAAQLGQVGGHHCGTSET